jgi:hypothetical protein
LLKFVITSLLYPFYSFTKNNRSALHAACIVILAKQRVSPHLSLGMGCSMEIFVETRRLLYNNNGGCLEMETQFFANLFIPILDSCGTGSLMAGKRIHVEKTRALRPPGAFLFGGFTTQLLVGGLVCSSIVFLNFVSDALCLSIKYFMIPSKHFRSPAWETIFLSLWTTWWKKFHVGQIVAWQFLRWFVLSIAS